LRRLRTIVNKVKDELFTAKNMLYLAEQIWLFRQMSKYVTGHALIGEPKPGSFTRGIISE